MVPVYVHSLSSLMPVKFVYKFNKAETFAGQLNSFKNGFSYYKYDGLENYQDAVLSNKTCLILTDNVPLKKIFETDSRQIDIGTIAGCLYLQASSGYYQNQYITSSNRGIYIGGSGTKLLLNVLPIEKNVVELKPSNDVFCQVDKNYPYTLKLSKEVLTGEDIRRQRFELEYKDNLIALRTLTDEGWRYLSYGVDRVVRGVGLMLNETIVNSYLFKTAFVSDGGIHYDFDAKTPEIKYYNDITTYGNRDNVNIKHQQDSNTNLLITVPTFELSKSNEVSVNIALTKTNFSASGSYITKQTP